MAPPKKHHYTPNLILRRFASDCGELWVLDKTNGRCWRKAGGSDQRYDAFAENHYNSVVDSAGNLDLSVEKHLEQIETAAAPVITTLVECAKAGIYPGLDFMSRKRLARFLWTQHLRTPWIRNQVAESEDARGYFQESVAKAKRLFDVPPEEIESLMGNEQDWTEEAAKLVVMTEAGAQRAVGFMTTKMRVDLRKAVDGAHFVTSDRPCLISPLALPGGKVVMALARDVMLQLSRPDETHGTVATLNSSSVDAVNQEVFLAASRFVAGPSGDYLRGIS